MMWLPVSNNLHRIANNQLWGWKDSTTVCSTVLHSTTLSPLALPLATRFAHMLVLQPLHRYSTHAGCYSHSSATAATRGPAPALAWGPLAGQAAGRPPPPPTSTSQSGPGHPPPPPRSTASPSGCSLFPAPPTGGAPMLSCLASGCTAASLLSMIAGADCATVRGLEPIWDVPGTRMHGAEARPCRVFFFFRLIWSSTWIHTKNNSTCSCFFSGRGGGKVRAFF